MALDSSVSIWAAKDVKTLIRAVKHTSYLYDTKDSKHFDQNSIQSGWKLISKFIGFKTGN